MSCLDEDTILAFCKGGLSSEETARAQAHVAECDECRALVSAVARSSLVGLTPHAGEVARVAMSSRPSFSSIPSPRSSVSDVAMAATAPSVRARAPEAPVKAGDVIAGKYEVEKVLGAGGMGIVVAARQSQLDRRVAIKFLLPTACEVSGAVARFLREGKAAAKITSEHVARVIDTGVLDAGAPYLVMEYLEGKDLGRVIMERGQVAPDDAIEWVLQAGEAIAEAHVLGIVHRDLKPANLFLTRRADGSALVKVLDFGISKTASPDGGRDGMTSASVMMGSPRYMSPEQMLSAKDVDARSDVWSLGVILFELVTGQPVWTADTVQGLCALIAGAPAPPLRSLAPDAPELLERIVDACLAKTRDSRVTSVAELAVALEPIAPARAKTSIERIRRVAGRGDAKPESVPPPSRTPSQAPTASTPAMARTDAEVRIAGETPPPSRLPAILVVAVAALLAAGIAMNALYVKSPAATPAATPPPPVVSLAPAATEARPTPTPSVSSEAMPLATTVTSATKKIVLRPATAAPSGAPVATAVPSATAAPSSSQPAPADSSRAFTDRK